MTHRIARDRIEFHPDRPIDVEFTGEEVSSDAGALLLGQADERLGLTAWFAGQVPDSRDPRRTSHHRAEQARQRVIQIALGYEDCNDADSLRHDRVLMTACGKLPEDPDGLSSQPTLSRFENAPNMAAIVRLVKGFEDRYVASLPPDTTTVVIDIDGTADAAYGEQQLALFNAFYDQHMYFPLPFFDDEGRLITVLLRPGNAHDSRGVKYVLSRIIRKIKARFPAACVLVRGDSHFGIPRIMDSVERLNQELGDIGYLFGLNTNPRLKRFAAHAMDRARREYEGSGAKARVLDDFCYKARSWPHSRHVVVRAEHSTLGANPRFVVTTLADFPPRDLYAGYCARGQAENHIKNFKNALQADRLSCSTFVANFFRLLLHAAAYQLVFALREELVVISPKLGRSQFDTLRLRLLKVAAIVKQSARRILMILPAAFPLRHIFSSLLRRLQIPRPET